MAKITNGHSFGITAQQAQAARLMAEGKKEDEVVLLLWGGPLAPGVKGAKTKLLHKWMQIPGFAECYRAIVKELSFSPCGAAAAKLIEQINSPNGWLANKAANDVLTRFAPAIMGTDDKAVTVRVEGMPLLGMPDGKDQDADA